MSSLKVTTIGNSIGVVLPKEILAILNVEKGDKLYITTTQNGIELRPYNKELADQMEKAKEIMKENRDLLRKLK